MLVNPANTSLYREGAAANDVPWSGLASRDQSFQTSECLEGADPREVTPGEPGSSIAREAGSTEMAPEVSVVMPCLNEADTLATCIRKARSAMALAGIRGEIVVADNGSTDASIEIAHREGARVVVVPERGYGAALLGGIHAAKGRFIIMGDADDSYDFQEVPTFVRRLREGYDLVQGCRLASGGGRVLPGAMPLLHRWLGNPMFSALARRWFRAVGWCSPPPPASISSTN